MAEWFAENGDPIHGTSGTPFPQSLDFAFCTRRETRLFFLLKNPGSGEVALNGIMTPVKRASVPFRQEGNAVRLMPPEFTGRTFPCVTLEFDRTPEIDSRLMPQNGVLSLAPKCGTPAAGNPPESVGTKTVAVSGERAGDQPDCRLANDGSLADWHHPGDRIEWNCSFPEGGTYRVRLTTRNRHHSSPWKGAREVELRWRGVPVLRARLAADLTLPGSYYAAAESNLGEIAISPGESGILSLHTTEAEAPAVEMTLVCLNLKKRDSLSAK